MPEIDSVADGPLAKGAHRNVEWEAWPGDRGRTLVQVSRGSDMHFKGHANLDKRIKEDIEEALGPKEGTKGSKKVFQIEAAVSP
jgi:hypothetical protein